MPKQSEVAAQGTQEQTTHEEPASGSLLGRIAVEVGTIFSLAWPQTVNGVTSFLPRLLMLVAVGHLDNGAVYIGAAGIGSMYANFAHIMLIRSSGYGAMGLFSQAFGAANHARVGLILMRVLVMHAILLCLVALPLTAAAAPLLATFGLPSAVSSFAQTFVWTRLLGLPGIIIFSDLQVYLNAQRCVRLPMVISICSASVQMALLFVLTRSLGFVGAPLAMTIAELLQGAAMLVATPWLLRRHKLRSWPSWRRDARKALHGWHEVLAKGGPGAVLIMAEWLGWECTIAVASGLCPPDGDACAPVEAIPICTQVFVLQFIIAFGAPLAMCIRIGNLLGEGRPAEACFCARVAWVMALYAPSGSDPPVHTRAASERRALESLVRTAPSKQWPHR